jgi:hypothetical protein
MPAPSAERPPGLTRPAPPPCGQPTEDWPGDDAPLTREDLAVLDRDLDLADFDPADYGYQDIDRDSSWPDAADAWLADLPSPVRARYLTGRPAVPEALVAGFVHDETGEEGEAALGFAAGGTADRMLPGAVLAGLTGSAWQVGLDRLSDDALIGAALAARRNASWQAALELAVVTELAARRDRAAQATRDQRGRDHFRQEIAAAFTLTGRGADAVLALAAGMARLPQAAGLLAAGVIDRIRAAVIADELACLDTSHAQAAAELVLPRAGRLTTSQRRAALRRAVLAIDPKAAIRRREEAQRDARVEAWAEAAGTAALAGRDLPPAGVLAADRHIDAATRWLKDHGVPGPLPALRAAVFLALLTGQPVDTLLTTQSFPGQPSGQPSGDPAPSAAPDAAPSDQVSLSIPPGGLSGSVHLTMPLAAWTGQSDAPGELAGLGPHDAGTCRDLAAALAGRGDTRWCLTLTDPRGRAVAHACARAGPGLGHGPGPPGSGLAAWFAGLKMSWLETGTCAHPRATSAYRPGPALRHLLTIRNPVCGSPGCRRPAVRCDDDHTVPYDQGGRTCECNLHPLCRLHHQAKQAPGWHLSQPQPGVLVWTLPHGRAYTVRPEPYPV